jgi:hypothetical protein
MRSDKKYALIKEFVPTWPGVIKMGRIVPLNDFFLILKTVALLDSVARCKK